MEQGSGEKIKRIKKSMTTIREMIAEKSALLRNVDKLGAQNAAEELVNLASLLSSLNAEIIEKQFILNQKRSELLIEAKSVAKAKMLSESTQEWKDFMDRVAQREALEELLRAVKYYLRAVGNEMQLGKKGLTEEFLKDISKRFENSSVKNIKISVLKSEKP